MKAVFKSFELRVLIIAILLVTGSCTKDSGPIIIRPDVPDTLSFQDTILPILVGNCAFSGCHPSAGGLDLGVNNAYADMVDVLSLGYGPYLRVKPFSPDSSVLYQKIIGNTDFGTQMPIGPGAVPLSDEETGLIYDWIAQGALDN